MAAARPAWQYGRVDFVVRAASPADAGDLVALWQEAAENSRRPPDTAEAVTALLGRDPEAVILAEHDGALIGSVIAGWDGWRYHLYRLAVRPDWRRRGVGAALLSAAERRLRDLGATRIDAMVLDDNDLGQNLWQASGYQRQDDWRRWVKTLLRGPYWPGSRRLERRRRIAASADVAMVAMRRPTGRFAEDSPASGPGAEG
jgi:ribosomal protein S18 acetylase RimI-like enzyme